MEQKWATFPRFLGQGFIMELTSCVWVESEVELIFPAEFKPCLRQRIITNLSTRVDPLQDQQREQRACK